MLSDLFAKWMSDLPGFVLVYLIAFGVRLGPKADPWFQIHGIVSSVWKLAENVSGVRNEIKSDFIAVKSSQTEIKAAIERVEKRINERPSDDSIRFSVGR